MTPPEFPEHPAPPVFIDDHSDVSVFLSVPEAATWIEPIDVQNHEYSGYDSLGRLLNLTTDGRSVRISLDEQSPTHADRLHATLQSFLRDVGDPVSDDTSYDLPRLVAHFTRYAPKPQRSLWQTVTSLFHARP